jgi:hypothetical protein
LAAGHTAGEAGGNSPQPALFSLTKSRHLLYTANADFHQENRAATSCRKTAHREKTHG